MRAWLTPEALPEAGATICRPLLIPADPRIIAAVNGAILTLTEAENWEAFGAVTPDAMAYRMLEMFEAWAASECSESGGGMAIGTIFPYITADPPTGAVACDGTEYADTDYPQIWDILDPAWLSDATHWVVPDLRDRFPVGAGSTYSEGDTGGAASVALTAANNGSHNHGLGQQPGGTIATQSITGVDPDGPRIGTAFFTLYSGSGTPHENRPPYLALKWAVQVE